MNLFYLMSGFPVTAIIIALLTFFLGYILKGRLYQANEPKKEESEGLKKEIARLEEDLSLCKKRNSAYKVEIDNLKAKLEEVKAASNLDHQQSFNLNEEPVQDNSFNQSDKNTSSLKIEKILPEQVKDKENMKD